ncbi:DUF2993 family protein [Herbihabitans rhizosphaerae]|uniref:DUF2993 family protein n=1 Tax=Herbihabitans rhizosphaerae TaxID=1872711 RepID=A0A4Q7L6F7_9PSEU|nr:DUF2993 domain-containing protein [Herbihabitans rhizosphaerae]RZS44927.1 DUF2993 family protein [Herbihabitans rhizosphaerae]
MTTRTTDGTTTGKPDVPQRRRRRSSPWRKIVIALVVLLTLGVIADFAGAAIFEYQVSKRAKDHFGLVDDPSVTVHGFPFLTQAASGKYERVEVVAKGVPVKNLRDLEVEAELRDVDAPLSDLMNGRANVKAREVEGKVKIKAADVNLAVEANKSTLPADITNLRIEPVSERTIHGIAAGETTGVDAEEHARAALEPEDTRAGAELRGTMKLADQETEITVYVIISLEGGRMTLNPQHAELKNDFGRIVPKDLLKQQILPKFAISLDPGNLPFRVTPTAVSVEPGALSVIGIAHDVTLAGSGR